MPPLHMDYLIFLTYLKGIVLIKLKAVKTEWITPFLRPFCESIFYFNNVSYWKLPIDFLSSHSPNKAHNPPTRTRIHVSTNRIPVNCPATKNITGNSKKTAPCWASSTLLALADARTVRVMAIRDTRSEERRVGKEC